MKIMIFRPQAIIRLALNLDKSKNALDKKDYSELLSIAIKPEMNGKGIGKNILDHFEKEVKLRGGKKLALTTDFENNKRVISFYKKCGYEIFYDFVTYPNRQMYKMIKTLK